MTEENKRVVVGAGSGSSSSSSLAAPVTPATGDVAFDAWIKRVRAASFDDFAKATGSLARGMQRQQKQRRKGDESESDAVDSEDYEEDEFDEIEDAKSADSDLDALDEKENKKAQHKQQQQQQQLDAQGNPVPYFVYMASVGPEGVARGKTGIAPHIGVTRNPLARVDEINRKGQRHCPRDCQKGSPYWTLQLVVAPFFGGSNGFQQFWVKKSRKLARRLVFGARLALGTFSDKVVYCADMGLVVRLLADVLGIGNSKD